MVSLTITQVLSQLHRFNKEIFIMGNIRGTINDTTGDALVQSNTGANYPAGREEHIYPQAPTSALGMLGAVASPVGAIVKGAAPSFMNQVNYGKNDAPAANYQALLADAGNAGMSQKDMVHMARQQYKDSSDYNQSPYDTGASAGNMLSGAPIMHVQEPSVANGQLNADGSPRHFAHGGSQQDQGIFKPVTFRSGVGTSTLTPEGVTSELGEDYAGLSGQVNEGLGLMGEAGALAQQDPNQFNYNFDPAARGQELFSQRSALLEPAFAQQRAKMNEGMFGSGRLGLRLAGEGAGAGSGMVQPDAFGMNQAQSQALSQLAAQSTTDAFGESMQRAGLDLSKFGVNQQAQQQQFANLMGSGQGMLGAGMAGAGLEMGLGGQALSAEALRQNYELGLDQNDIARMQAQAAIDKANYQPDPWLTGLTSLGTSFLGSAGGSNWLSKGFSKGGWFS